jgi:hypothetical protein
LSGSGRAASPQARKLGLAPGRRVVLDDRPDGWTLSDPPDGLIDAGPDGPADIVVGFVRTAGALERRLPGLARRIFPAGMLWVAWPRRAGGHTSDITDTVVRALALPLGLVDTKVAALDEDWSALRLIWRRERRSEPPGP